MKNDQSMSDFNRWANREGQTQGGGEDAVSPTDDSGGGGGGLRRDVGRQAEKHPKLDQNVTFFHCENGTFYRKTLREGGESRLQLLEFRADIETFVFGLKQADIFGWLHS